MLILSFRPLRGPLPEAGVRGERSSEAFLAQEIRGRRPGAGATVSVPRLPDARPRMFSPERTTIHPSAFPLPATAATSGHVTAAPRWRHIPLGCRVLPIHPLSEPGVGFSTPPQFGGYLGKQPHRLPRDQASPPYLRPAFASPAPGALVAALWACPSGASATPAGEPVGCASRHPRWTSCLEGRSFSSWNRARLLRVLL